MLTTTLKDIRAKEPCASGFAKIRDHLGISAADAKTHDKPFPLALLLETNDLEDTLWVLDKCINPFICRLFAADCAERVLHLFECEFPNDDRPRKAVDVARDPDSTDEDRAASWAAAGDAARAASWDAAGGAAWAAAEDAAWAAARAAAGGAAGDAAGDASWAAARAASWAAAGDASWDAAEDAQIERLKQYLEHGEAAKDMPWPGE